MTDSATAHMHHLTVPTSPQDVGERVSRVVHEVAAEQETSIERLSRELGLARSKLYEVFSGEKNMLVEYLYRCTSPALLRALLADIASSHGLAIVDVETPSASATTSDPREGLRLVEQVATTCGKAVAETARAVADGQVDAAEGAALEEHGHELVERGRRLISLGRRAKRERAVRVDGGGR